MLEFIDIVSLVSVSHLSHLNFAWAKRVPSTIHWAQYDADFKEGVWTSCLQPRILHGETYLRHLLSPFPEFSLIEIELSDKYVSHELFIPTLKYAYNAHN